MIFVGIVYDEKKEKAKGLANKVKKYLESRNCRVCSEKLETVLKKSDLVITFGGDGLVLHTADKISNQNRTIPLFRVNFGRIGFLTNVEPKEAFKRIDDFLGSKYIIVRKSRIEVEIRSRKNSNSIIKANALNEIVIERTQARALSFQVMVNNHEKIERQGDGLIFSTRTGSSAYNRSVGGPILIKENRFLLTVISPVVREKSFYFVRSADSIFRILKISGETRIVVDGKHLLKISEDDLVTIKKSPQNTLFMEFGDL